MSETGKHANSLLFLNKMAAKQQRERSATVTERGDDSAPRGNQNRSRVSYSKTKLQHHKQKKNEAWERIARDVSAVGVARRRAARTSGAT